MRLGLGRTGRRILVCAGLWLAAWLWAGWHPRVVVDEAAPGDEGLLREALLLQRGVRGAGAVPPRLKTAQQLVDLSRLCETPEAQAEILFDASALNAAGGELRLALIQCMAASRLADSRRRSELELEMAHLERRLGLLDAAGSSYLRLVAGGLLSAPDRDLAAHWCARIAEDQGRTRLAQDRWRVLARTASLPRRRLLAYERLVLSLCRDGLFQEARSVFQELKSALGPQAQAVTQQGKQLRESYGKSMRRIKRELSVQVN
ncbi:MAG TPA: hypothetical protein EYF98_00500 [Planctomycetes bacterium]|nr:hypothetical protein [Planctomycetota bacterium]